MCLTCVKHAVVCTEARVMLIPGAPPLFEAVVIFSAVSKGQRLMARGKKWKHRSDREHTHPLGNKHISATVTCDSLNKNAVL